jgi:tetraacyldisaccharide 4'-kinase
MHAPEFWWRDRPGPVAQLLRPLGSLYGRISVARMASAPTLPTIPILCVGNFVVGGAGKTPTAMALAQLLKSRGETVFFLSRGHGGDQRAKPLLVDPHQHSARAVGDEPLLLARLAPTIVSRDRLAGAVFAARLGASLIIMDDGMQNPTIAKHCVLAVVDGRTGIGNGLCFPAGPLRAPIEAQIHWAHAIILIGDIAAGRSIVSLAQTLAKPVLKARLVADPRTAAELDGQRIIAFAGIARPEKFFETLERSGAIVVGQCAFSDHHRFTAADCDELRSQAKRQRAILVTTEKDWVRLPAGFPARALPVALVFADERQVARLLAETLLRRRT